jgi:hypothetical protein
MIDEIDRERSERGGSPTAKEGLTLPIVNCRLPIADFFLSDSSC